MLFSNLLPHRDSNITRGTAIDLCFVLLFLTHAIASVQAGKPEVPLHIPASGGEVVIATAKDKSAYDEYHYAPSRRVGDTLYLSGVVVSRRDGEGKDTAALLGNLPFPHARMIKISQSEPIKLTAILTSRMPMAMRTPGGRRPVSEV